jgi:hypothetical protein
LYCRSNKKTSGDLSEVIIARFLDHYDSVKKIENFPFSTKKTSISLSSSNSDSDAPLGLQSRPRGPTSGPSSSSESVSSDYDSESSATDVSSTDSHFLMGTKIAIATKANETNETNATSKK